MNWYRVADVTDVAIFVQFLVIFILFLRWQFLIVWFHPCSILTCIEYQKFS